MTDQAKHAIRAAKLYKTIGRYAAYRYAENKLTFNNLRLYYLARVLEAATNIREVRS